MIQRVLTNYHLPLLTCVGLVIFLTVFFGVIVWVFRKGSSRFYSGMERIPLEEIKPVTFDARREACVQ